MAPRFPDAASARSRGPKSGGGRFFGLERLCGARGGAERRRRGRERGEPLLLEVGEPRLGHGVHEQGAARDAEDAAHLGVELDGLVHRHLLGERHDHERGARGIDEDRLHPLGVVPQRAAGEGVEERPRDAQQLDRVPRRRRVDDDEVPVGAVGTGAERNRAGLTARDPDGVGAQLRRGQDQVLSLAPGHRMVHEPVREQMARVGVARFVTTTIRPRFSSTNKRFVSSGGETMHTGLVKVRPPSALVPLKPKDAGVAGICSVVLGSRGPRPAGWE